jgi:replicative DNA helicase Mcm
MPANQGSAAVTPPGWVVNLITKKYRDDLLFLGMQLPERTSLKISMSDVHDIDAISAIYDYPDDSLSHLKNAAKEFLSDFFLDPEYLDRIRIEIIDVSDTELIRISQIRKEHVNRLVKIKCYTMGMTPTTPRILVAAYECLRCGHCNYIVQEHDKLIEPFECENDVCGRRSAFKLDERKSTQQDFQILRFQERQEDIRGGEKPQTAKAEITEEHCGTILPGNRVTIAAIVRERLKVRSTGKTNQFSIILDVVSITPDETESRITYTREDVDRLNKYVLEIRDFDEWVIDSYAPNIYGLREVKESLLIQQVSSGYSRSKIDNTVIRDFIHVALIGDPGVAKSSLKYAMKAYDPGIVLSSGTGASVAGLTAAVVKDDLTEGYTFEAGVLPLADGRGAILDEFDKLIQADMKHLNDALDECRFTVHKASIHMDLWARCWMTALLNPVDGRINNYEPLYKQVGIPPDTLSRFDLVFVIPDIREEAKDSHIGYAMLNARGIPHSGSNGNSPGPERTLMPLEDMQKLIAYAKTINPILSREAGDEIHRQWMRGRKSSGEDKIAVTSRFMGALIRLAKAEAQIHLSNEVNLYHVRRAVKLLEASLLQTCLDKDGEIDSDKISTGFTKDMRSTLKTIREVIRSCSKEGSPASIGDIALAVEQYNIAREELNSHLSHLKHNGEIFETGEGKWRIP